MVTSQRTNRIATQEITIHGFRRTHPSSSDGGPGFGAGIDSVTGLDAGLGEAAVGSDLGSTTSPDAGEDVVLWVLVVGTISATSALLTPYLSSRPNPE